MFIYQKIFTFVLKIRIHLSLEIIVLTFAKWKKSGKREEVEMSQCLHFI